MAYVPQSIFSLQDVERELRKIAELSVLIERGNVLVRYVAPEKPRDGDVAVCDGVHWNPIGDGVKRPIWFDETAGIWKIF